MPYFHNLTESIVEEHQNIVTWQRCECDELLDVKPYMLSGDSKSQVERSSCYFLGVFKQYQILAGYYRKAYLFIEHVVRAHMFLLVYAS